MSVNILPNVSKCGEAMMASRTETFSLCLKVQQLVQLAVDERLDGGVELLLL